MTETKFRTGLEKRYWAAIEAGDYRAAYVIASEGQLRAVQDNSDSTERRWRDRLEYLAVVVGA